VKAELAGDVEGLTSTLNGYDPLQLPGATKDNEWEREPPSFTPENSCDWMGQSINAIDCPAGMMLKKSTDKCKIRRDA
jgi:hypothetical protein